MGRIVIVVEEVCVDCRRPMGEDGYETDDFSSESSNEVSPVKRKKKLGRCGKCQPIFQQKIDKLKEEGKVRVIPFGMSGRNAEDRQRTMKDFIGRDRSRHIQMTKKEAGHDNRLL